LLLGGSIQYAISAEMERYRKKGVGTMKGTARISESKMSSWTGLIVLVLFSLVAGHAVAEDGGVARTFWWNLEYLDLTKQK